MISVEEYNQARVDEYARAVVSGEIVTGRLARAAVDRYLADLERDWEYWFDQAAASRACDFFRHNLRHSTGGTAGQPFELVPFQQFVIWNVFGWKRADGTRRFRRAFLSMARKNGKSTLAAGIAIYMACQDINPRTKQPESRSEVLLAATQRTQAEIIYNEIKNMLDAAPALKNKWREYKALPAHIFFKENGAKVMAVGSDRPKDGFNPSLCILDEVHAFSHVHKPTYDTLLTAGGFRDQPLVVTVTTAGDNTSWIWEDEWRYAKGVVEREFTDETLFALCYEIDPEDDPLDPAVWIKANPNLGTCLHQSYLEKQANEARNSPLRLNTFTRYHANRVVSSIDAAFNMSEWDNCKGELSDWSEADAIGAGIDPGGRNDLGSFCLCARFPLGEVDDENKPTYRYEMRSWSYLAQDTTRDVTEQPFEQWIREKRLNFCKYPMSQLRDDLLALAEEYFISMIAFDPANGQQLAEDLEEALGSDRVGRMGQSTRMFNEPIRDWLQSITDGRFRHDGDPILRWCASNAVLVKKGQDEVMFDKKTSREKIDTIVAGAMAYRMAMIAKPGAVFPCELAADDVEEVTVQSTEDAVAEYARRIFLE